jgi:lysophospholipase
MISNEIDSFWKTAKFDQFKGVNGVIVAFAYFKQIKKDSDSILLVPGRGESYYKYQNLAFDFFNRGYNVFIIDHRGQGYSQRLLENNHKGYVKKFQDYVNDLAFFVDNIVMKNNHKKPYLIAHSMGGTIAARYMQDHPNAIKAAVLSCPMLGFNTGFLPQSFAELLVSSLLTLNNWLGTTPWYFLGQQNFKVKEFTDNNLTHSFTRYKDFVTLYKNNGAIQLGGVTSHWLLESVKAQKVIFDNLNKLKTPIIVFNASADKIVCKKAQQKFCRILNGIDPSTYSLADPISFKGAYHELFFEIDEYRDQAISLTIDWFQQYQQS